MDTVAYGLLNKKIKGLASGVKSATVSGTSIVFTMNDNSKQTITFPTPKNGASIVDVEVNADNTITCTLSDGTSVTSTNKINTIKGDDGFSPVITENAGNTDDVYKLDITDSTHTFTTPNLKGEVGNLADYQKKEDNSLDTTNKSVVGAINELKTDSHTHDNKTDVLDKLSVNTEGTLLFDGNEIKGGANLTGGKDIEIKDDVVSSTIYLDDWKQSTEYKINDKVKYGYKDYKCIEDHTSSTAFDDSKWQLIGLSELHVLSVTQEEYDKLVADGTITEGTRDLYVINDGEGSSIPTTTSWGNITGTLENQTDLKDAMDEIKDSIPKKASDIDALPVTTTIPRNMSQLINDSHYQTDVDVDNTLADYAKKLDIPSVDNFVEKETGKSLIDDTEIARLAGVDNYDDTAITKRISDIEADYIKSTDLAIVATSGSYNDLEDKPTIPDAYDDTDVKNDITAVSDRVTDIEADYTTKVYVGEQIANAEHLKREIVTEIPEASTADDHTIYMLKVEDVTGNDKYREYMLIDGAIEIVGDTSVDLTDYAKTAYVDEELAKKANVDEIPVVPTSISAFANDSGYLVADDITDLESKAHEHDNKDVIDKFTESDNGKPLYDGAEIISDNIWHGTKEEFDAIETKDENVTYVVTDEKGSVVDYFIDDSSTSTDKTWSSKKINNDCVSNTVSLQMLVPDGSDVASYICNQKKTYLRYYTTTTSKVTNAPTDTANGYIWYCLDANLVITARNSKGEIWINSILNSNPTGWKKMNSSTVKDVGATRVDISNCEETLSANRTLVYMVKNGICYVSFLNVRFKTGVDTIFDVGVTLPIPATNYFWFPLVGVSDPTKSTLIHPTIDGKLEHHNTDTTMTYSGSFSYLVAEN